VKRCEAFAYIRGIEPGSRNKPLAPGRCNDDALPDGRFCWVHQKALENPNRTTPLIDFTQAEAVHR
jgi:hypothetical protein